MKRLYFIYWKLSGIIQPFFGGLFDSIFKFITNNLNVRILDEDVEYKTIEILRINKIKRINRTFFNKKKYIELSKSLVNFGYEPVKFNYITLDNDNNIIDGSKRLSILRSMHGNYLKIKVKMITFKQDKEILMARKQLLFGFLIILLIILTIINL